MNAYRKRSSREDRESDVVYKRRKGKEEEPSDDSDVEICVPLSKRVTAQKGEESNGSLESIVERRSVSKEIPTESSLRKEGKSVRISGDVPSHDTHQLIKERLSKSSGYVPDPS